MELKEYLEKAGDICNENTCPTCQLRPFHCGVPKKKDINKCITLITNYKVKGCFVARCGSCGRKLAPELISEHNIKHCPWCGEKVN